MVRVAALDATRSASFKVMCIIHVAPHDAR
jgi:hypothetical protein